jgi:hypothetical protein
LPKWYYNLELLPCVRFLRVWDFLYCFTCTHSLSLTAPWLAPCHVTFQVSRGWTLWSPPSLLPALSLWKYHNHPTGACAELPWGLEPLSLSAHSVCQAQVTKSCQLAPQNGWNSSGSHKHQHHPRSPHTHTHTHTHLFSNLQGPQTLFK